MERTEGSEAILRESNDSWVWTVSADGRQSEPLRRSWNATNRELPLSSSLKVLTMKNLAFTAKRLHNNKSLDSLNFLVLGQTIEKKTLQLEFDLIYALLRVIMTAVSGFST